MTRLEISFRTSFLSIANAEISTTCSGISRVGRGGVDVLGGKLADDAFDGGLLPKREAKGLPRREAEPVLPGRALGRGGRGGFEGRGGRGSEWVCVGSVYVGYWTGDEENEGKGGKDRRAEGRVEESSSEENFGDNGWMDERSVSVWLWLY